MLSSAHLQSSDQKDTVTRIGRLEEGFLATVSNFDFLCLITKRPNVLYVYRAENITEILEFFKKSYS